MVDLSIANWDSLPEGMFQYLHHCSSPPASSSSSKMFQGICPGQSIVTATRLYYVVFSYCHFFLLCYTYTLLYYSLLCHLYIYIYGFVSRLKIGYAQRKCWLSDGFWAPQVAKQKENIVEWKVPSPYFGVPMIPNGWLVFAGRAWH